MKGEIDYNSKILNFLAMTDTNDQELAVKYLEKSNWDETEAVNKFLNNFNENSNNNNDLINNIEDDIYVYNPSSIFIEIGYNDLVNGVDESTIISNLEEIIEGIKSNREYSKIYIESLYPIEESDEEDNQNITNKQIISLNKKIKKLTETLEVNYVDMYNELLEDDSLKDNYTDDGINLNEDGYKRVFKVINRIVEEEHEEVK